jgi:ubiquinone/menaquinone biosynthesis C-methylase UbiE
MSNKTTPAKPIERTGVKENVKQQFGQAASNYVTSPIHAAGEDLQAMVQIAEPAGTERVLDAGCGAGHTALAFAPHVAEVIAFDLSPEMLTQVDRLAKARALPNIRTKQGDIEALPFDDASFDRVASRYSAHHWPNPQRALAEIRRVLKPGGSLLLADVVSFEDFATDTYLQAIELLRDPSHVRDHTVIQWHRMLEAANLPAETVLAWSIPIDFAPWVARIHTPQQHIAMLRTLLDEAPEEVREALQVQPNHNFTFPGALLRATASREEG